MRVYVCGPEYYKTETTEAVRVLYSSGFSVVVGVPEIDALRIVACDMLYVCHDPGRGWDNATWQKIKWADTTGKKIVFASQIPPEKMRVD